MGRIKETNTSEAERGGHSEGSGGRRDNSDRHDDRDSGSKAGGNFGGWDGRGSTKPSPTTNRSYYEEKERKERKERERQEQEQQKQERQTQKDTRTAARRGQNADSTYRGKNRRQNAQTGFTDEQDPSLTGDNSPDDYDYYDNNGHLDAASDPRKKYNSVTKGGTYNYDDLSPEQEKELTRVRYKAAKKGALDAKTLRNDKLGVDAASDIITRGLPVKNIGQYAATQIGGQLPGAYMDHKAGILSSGRHMPTEFEQEAYANAFEDVSTADSFTRHVKERDWKNIIGDGLKAVAAWTGGPVGALPGQAHDMSLVADAAAKWGVPKSPATRRSDAKKGFDPDLYDDKDNDNSPYSGGMLATNKPDSPAPQPGLIGGGLALSSYDWDYNSHLNNFTRG